MKLPKPILALLTIVLVIGLSVAVFLTSRQGTFGFRTKAEKGEAFLFLIPSEVRVERGSSVELSVKLDTGSEVAGGVEAVITFNEEYLSPQAVDAGPAFPDLVSEINEDSIILKGVGNISGQGTVANITFDTFASGVANVKLDDSSQVWGEGGSVSILNSLQGAKVSIE